MTGQRFVSADDFSSSSAEIRLSHNSPTSTGSKDHGKKRNNDTDNSFDLHV